MTDVMARVRKHYERATAHYGEQAVLGVFLYGSWNYGTNLPDSDVDTKCILIPNIYSLAVKPYEVKHLHVDDEVCECMTIMHMVSNWKKQNINFVEILFTDYCIINPLYQDLWFEWMTAANREAIARYDVKAAVLSMAHQALHTLKQDPNDLKKVMNTARIIASLSKLTSGEPISYRETIRATDRTAKIRTGETPVPAGIKEGFVALLEDMIERAELGAYKTPDVVKQNLDSFFEDLICEFIKYRIGEING